MYLIRLDDASEYIDVAKWQRVESILDRHGVKPLVGIIPANHDPKFCGVYNRYNKFWEQARLWERKGWELAMHGWHHVYTMETGGINPVNFRSEFAGLPLERQCEMIRDGLTILRSHGIVPRVFFAPSHTFDENTIEALRRESDIRIISDTVANDVYYKNGFYFVPVQSGQCRRLPLKVVTICLHPNIMSERGFRRLESFLQANSEKMLAFNEIKYRRRNHSALDAVLQKIYFLFRRIK